MSTVGDFSRSCLRAVTASAMRRLPQRRRETAR
jgi:hypothetical protein